MTNSYLDRGEAHTVFRGVLIQAAALVNGTTVTRDVQRDEPFINYYHVEVTEHALLLAEGVASESFLPTAEHIHFHNWAERVAPEFLVELPFARVKSARQLPSATRQRLATRRRHLDTALDEAA